MIQENIQQLLEYGLEQGMINEEEWDYSCNLLLNLYKLDHFEKQEVKKEDFYTVLDTLVQYAVDQKWIEDTATERDLWDTRVMNCIMPRPSEVIRTFKEKYTASPEEATKYFYALSIHSNYIRKNRTDKNICFNYDYKYGTMQITINLSKPEKDPKEIAKAKLVKSTGYPKCLLCKENVGFAGTANHPARQTHRIIPLDLAGDHYFLQYSPYVYYNEHCIVFNENHVPMVISKETFKHLLSFVDQFPHYLLGSNADLPIVGGSILTHDHYQGGRHTFPMENAKVLKQYTVKGYEDVEVEMLYWPLSTLRIKCADKERVIALADHILQTWIPYSDEKADILAYTEDTRHNTITPIARKKNGKYEMDLVLRNNRTTEQYPLGIFHPHPEHHHIKKENIGLVEVMGLAVLPARLKTELEELELCLLGKKNITDYPELEKHKEWFAYLQTLSFDETNVHTVLEQEVAKKYVQVLENAGVYKMDEEGIQAFERFISVL